MRAKARLLGHPVHPMLVVFPLGLLPVSFLFDLVALGAGPSWYRVTFWMIFAGVAGALCAAVFGFADWLAVPPGTRAKTIGLWHGAGNAGAVGLFVGSWSLRLGRIADPGALAIFLSGAGVALLLVTAWLGGELVERLGIGVYEDAGPNAPSSLHLARVAPRPRP